MHCICMERAAADHPRVRGPASLSRELGTLLPLRLRSGVDREAVALRRRAWQRRRLHRVRASGRDEASSTADRVRELRPPSGLEGTAAGRARRGRRPVMRSTQGDATRRMSAAAERARKCAGSIRPVLVPQTMHARPATASRCASLAARLGERRSGVRRLSVLWARSWARRRSGVRFSVAPSL